MKQYIKDATLTEVKVKDGYKVNDIILKTKQHRFLGIPLGEPFNYYDVDNVHISSYYGQSNFYKYKKPEDLIRPVANYWSWNGSALYIKNKTELWRKHEVILKFQNGNEISRYFETIKEVDEYLKTLPINDMLKI